MKAKQVHAGGSILLCLCLAACGRQAQTNFVPVSDLTPPVVLKAGPKGADAFLLGFDEAVSPIAGTFFLEPGPQEARAEVSGNDLTVVFGSALDPGSEYRVSGEVEDAHGNSTRFIFTFNGWNARPPSLCLSEVQTGKNSSKTAPHRDFIELRALSAGNLGGVEVSWASSIKQSRHIFPAAEVEAGDYIVLHLAPEGIPEEKDETGADLALSGGVDSSAVARDFWSGSGPLSDGSGALAAALRPGEAFVDALFYADQEKAGPMKVDKLSAFVEALGEAWPMEVPAKWEDALRWKPSTARSLNRLGSGSWYVGDSGKQSPGEANIPVDAAAASRSAARSKKK